MEVLRHFEFESFLNSLEPYLEPKVRTIVKDRAVYMFKTSQWHALCKKTSLAGMLAAGRHQACTKPGPGSDLEVTWR